MRTQDKYSTKVEELNSLKNAISTKYGKEYEKANSKVTKVESSVMTLEGEYRLAREQLELAEKSWETDWYNSLREFELLEKERLIFLKYQSIQFCKGARDLCIAETQVIKSCLVTHVAHY
jgi:hypothetical protein